MKVGNVSNGLLGLGMVAGVALTVYTLIKGKQALTFITGGPGEKNIAARAADQITQAVTGDQNATLGTKVYDVTHSAPSDSSYYQTNQAIQTCEYLHRNDPDFQDKQFLHEYCVALYGDQGLYNPNTVN